MKRNTILLLVVIYLVFIALGLPDALVGSAWNTIRIDLDVPLGAIGVTTMVAYVMTIFSTYNAPRLLRRFETKTVTFVSVLLTALAILLMSRVTHYWQMVLLAMPLGFGAGAIDLSLNHYIARYYKASHMNYLHSFWGLGVTFGPMVMALTLRDGAWRIGYVIVGLVLLAIAFFVLLSYRLWEHEPAAERHEQHSDIKTMSLLNMKGIKSSLAIVLFYVHIESLAGVFVASYFYVIRGVSSSTAALFTTTYFLALTVGRIVSGAASHKLHPNRLIVIGEVMILIAAILLSMNVTIQWYYFLAVALLGIGSGPVFPNMMFMNQRHFPVEHSSKITSLQMVVGYLGFGALTPLAGVVFQETSIRYYPFLILIVSVLLILFTIHFLRLRLSNTTT